MNPNITLLAVTLVSSNFLWADGWPQFRGPDGAATAVEGAAIPTEWSAEKNLKWKTPLPGPGSSSPILWEDKIFVTCYTGYGVKKEEPGEPNELGRELVCVDRVSGDILWSKEVGLKSKEDDYRGYLMEHGYASATPVTDGKHVFVFLGKGGLHAFTLEGEKAWSKEVGTSSGDKRWGSAASPVLHGDLLIVNAADEARGVIAFDKKSGEERWRYESDKLELAYNTPTIHSPEGGRTEIVVSAPEELFALDPANGKRLWFLASDIPGNICPSVVSAGETLFTTGGWPRKGSLAVKGGGAGDVTDKILWRSKTFSYVPTPLVHEGLLHWVSDEGKAIVMDLKSGKVLTNREVDGIPGRKQMSFYASAVRVGDKIFVVSRRDGTFVFEANKEMKQIAQNDLGDETDFNATPAVAKDAIYLRSNAALYCVGE
ncbi:MAG: PQQ-like beta-propeller repeat protein [Verrucomicrobia bacterium]|nr:PQQ-like beta-propeller repeat protein [Verrucomicrobiota bacterium]MDA1006498.1 PQQ-like beta-propeller repeat protein [Verrucomicrobiota bacterium]